MGVNAAGLRSTNLTFKKVLNELQPSAFFVEETKLKEAGKIKLDNYIIFEKVRKDGNNGGGIAFGCLPELKPVWLREGEDPVEALSVQIFVGKLKIRCCVAYGFQETDTIEKKDEFWKYMDEEVLEAENSGSGLVIQFDGNLWAGKEIIPNDPRPQNRNGKLFQQFLARHSHLTVVNSLSVCEGLITRSRFRDGKLEESVLDFFIVCHLMLPHIKRMVIDVDKKFVLTNYEQAHKGGKASDSDHATEYLDFDLKVIKEKPDRRLIWNFKNKEAQSKFKLMTSETLEFTNCFNNNLHVLEQIDNWKAVFENQCKKAFNKVRVTKKKFIKHLPAEISKLIDRRNKLMKNDQGACEAEIRNIDEVISSMEAETKRNEIMKHFNEISKDPENVNLNEVWKTMNRLWPKVQPILPSAKKDHRGRLVTAPNEIKKLLSKEYRERLRTRPVRPDLENLEPRKKRIFKMKLKLAEARPTQLWEMSDLDVAL